MKPPGLLVVRIDSSGFSPSLDCRAERLDPWKAPKIETDREHKGQDICLAPSIVDAATGSR